MLEQLRLEEERSNRELDEAIDAMIQGIFKQYMND